MTSPRIALIHATPVAIAPVTEAFAHGWPEAEVYSLLDDSLSADLERAGQLDAEMFNRFDRLADYVADCGANGILFTCSAFGVAIEAVAERLAPMPVLRPNEAMFDAALGMGRRFGMLATFGPSVPSMEGEFRDMAARAGNGASIESHCEPAAMEALRSGDAETHNRLVAEAAPRFSDRDAVMLAHFSTSRARAAVEARIDRPVLTSPDSAVEKLRRLL